MCGFCVVCVVRGRRGFDGRASPSPSLALRRRPPPRRCPLEPRFFRPTLLSKRPIPRLLLRFTFDLWFHILSRLAYDLGPQSVRAADNLFSLLPRTLSRLVRSPPPARALFARRPPQSPGAPSARPPNSRAPSTRRVEAAYRALSLLHARRRHRQESQTAAIRVNGSVRIERSLARKKRPWRPSSSTSSNSCR